MTARRPALSLLLALPAALTFTAAAGCRNGASDSTLILNGRIEAVQVDLAPKVAGRVVEVRVRQGDRVKAGDLLVVLDLGETAIAVERDRGSMAAAEARARDLEAGSRRAEIAAAQAELRDRRAALALAERELARQEQLLASRVGTPRDVDRARTELDRARAAVEASQQRLALVEQGSRAFQKLQAREEVDRAQSVLAQSESLARESQIHAPADAIVLYRLAEPGQLVGPGQPAITLAFADRLYVRTYIPQTRLGQVRQGQAVTVHVDTYPDRDFPARITEISPEAEFTPKPVETRRERVNLVYAAKADLDAGWDAPLVPGQPAEVVVALGSVASPPAGSSPTAPGTSPTAPGKDTSR